MLRDFFESQSLTVLTSIMDVSGMRRSYSTMAPSPHTMVLLGELRTAIYNRDQRIIRLSLRQGQIQSEDTSCRRNATPSCVAERRNSTL